MTEEVREEEGGSMKRSREKGIKLWKEVWIRKVRKEKREKKEEKTKGRRGEEGEEKMRRYEIVER